MKDECIGKIMNVFIALRSKMYCFRIDNCEKKKVGKGVKKEDCEQIDMLR